MKKIGFFGGSFDPIHFGHLNLAIAMLERGELDEILFCPAACSPFKTQNPPKISGKHRFEMISRVIAGIPGLKVTSIEVDQKCPSYTIDSIKKMLTGSIQFNLILGEDAASGLVHWKDFAELIALAPPLIGSRSGESRSAFQTIKTPIFEVSSTEVRDRLKKNLYCGHLVPRIALDYIEQHRLYSQ